MKKFFFLMFFGACTFFSSCQGGSAEVTSEVPVTEEYHFESSEYLVLDCEIPSSFQEILHDYEVHPFVPDKELVIKGLMLHQPTEDILSEAPKAHIYLWKDKVSEKTEYVSIGESFDQGYLNYKLIDSPSAIEVFSLKTDLSKRIFTDNYIEYPVNGYFNAFTDKSLSFASQNEVVQIVLGKLSSIGLSDVSVKAIFSRDQETLNMNRDIYNQYYNDRSEKIYEKYGESSSNFQVIDYDYSAMDEDYWLLMQQTIEGIPVSTDYWAQLTTEANTSTIFEAVFTQKGLISLDCRNLYQIECTLDDVSVCPPEAALIEYQKEYDQALHLDSTYITDISLEYIIISDRSHYIAKPAWIIRTRTNAYNSLGIMYESYNNIAIDAKTLQTLTVMSERK